MDSPNAAKTILHLVAELSSSLSSVLIEIHLEQSFITDHDITISFILKIVADCAHLSLPFVSLLDIR